MTNDPKNPDDLCPFYDPNHKCGIVREHVFKDCLNELRERNRLLDAELDRGMQTMAVAEITIYKLISERDEALESASRHDALSSAGMAKILELESGNTQWRYEWDQLREDFKAMMATRNSDPSYSLDEALDHFYDLHPSFDTDNSQTDRPQSGSVQ